MSTAIHLTGVVLDAMSYDAAAAMSAQRRQCMNGALEGVEDMSGAVERDNE
jgi:hypothetical protein